MHWQFGVFLFQLCTGYPLFNMDSQENVSSSELQKIAQWGGNEKSRKLAELGKGWPRRLVSQLLSKNPFERPQHWGYVLKRLGGGSTSDEAMNINACSVHHLMTELMPKTDAALSSRLAESSDPLGVPPYLQSPDEGSIW